MDCSLPGHTPRSWSLGRHHEDTTIHEGHEENQFFFVILRELRAFVVTFVFRTFDARLTGSSFKRAPADSSVSRYSRPSGPCLTSAIRCLSSSSSVSRRVGSPLAFKTIR